MIPAITPGQKDVLDLSVLVLDFIILLCQPNEAGANLSRIAFGPSFTSEIRSGLTSSQLWVHSRGIKGTVN